MPISNPLVPLSRELLGYSKVVLKGAGLAHIKPKFFQVDTNKIERESYAYQRSEANIAGGNGGYDIAAGMLGLPVWDIVTLVAEPYTTDDGTVITTKSQLQLEIALCEVSNPRNIVKTGIAGRNGTVKEYMSDGDYHVNIKGSLCRELSNMPPEELLFNLKTIIEHPEAVTVYSNFLSYFDINQLVIEEPVIRQREGTRNVVDFELRCVSDRPVILEK